jgi:glutamine amidotransferase
MLVIVDYGMGNIGSVCQALTLLGVTHLVSRHPDDLQRADAIVLPGVGAFAAAMANLRSLGFVDALTQQVIGDGKPFLGICLGLQLIAQDSVENGYAEGLGWIDGHVVALEPRGLRVPHVGWNGIRYSADDPLFARVTEPGYFYFDHSFHLQCPPALVTATVDYGTACVAAVRKGNIEAVQFHPEKSQRNGLKLLRNFTRSVERRIS